MPSVEAGSKRPKAGRYWGRSKVPAFVPVLTDLAARLVVPLVLIGIRYRLRTRSMSMVGRAQRIPTAAPRTNRMKAHGEEVDRKGYKAARRLAPFSRRSTGAEDPSL